MRLFVALAIPDRLAPEVRATRDRLQAADARSEFRWTRDGAFHLTLAFLGETDPARVPALEAALGPVAGGATAPSLALAGLGGFPNRSRPRVIWLGLAERGGSVGGLAGLADGVWQALGPLGWTPERRPFAPHLTLGRRRDVRNAASVAPTLAAALATTSGLAESESVAWTRLALVESVLGPGGSRYTDVATWQLHSAETQGLR